MRCLSAPNNRSISLPRAVISVSLAPVKLNSTLEGLLKIRLEGRYGYTLLKEIVRKERLKRKFLKIKCHYVIHHDVQPQIN